MKLSEQIYITDLGDDWKGIYSPFQHGIAFIKSNDLFLLEKGELGLNLL
ncbi:MAG: hypothetical protein KAX49_09200 [Halanaerobiales bacterium]|nr:hypothetical protein [Halanaerobiales bacterium]